MANTSTKPGAITAKICTMYKPHDAEGVPAPTMVAIYRDNLSGGYQVHVIRNNVCESLKYKRTERAAVAHARSLGYAEMVLA